MDEHTGEHFDTPAFHYDLWNGQGDTLDIVPRGYAKTTAISKIENLHDLLFQTEQSILLIASEGLGEEIIGDIRIELETNPIIHKIWGNLVPTADKRDYKVKKWRQSHLQLLNGTEIETVTRGGKIRGKRPTKIDVDDPQENKDVKNPRIALDFWHWFWTAVYNTLMPGGRVRVLGTIISDNCFVNMLKVEAKERGFAVHQFAAIDNFDEEHWTGTPLWPERWSLEALKLRAKKIGMPAFMQEFMHIPMITHGVPVFSHDYEYKVLEPVSEKDGVQYFRKLLDDKNEPTLSVFIGMDLAFGRVGGDFSTIIVRDIEGHLLAQYRGYCAQDVLAKVLDGIMGQVKGAKIVPENNSALAFLQAARNYGWYRSIYRKETLDKITNQRSEILGWNTNDKTKPLMVNALDQRLREGEWEVSQEEHDELLHYYYDENGAMNAISPYHDDLVIGDALAVQAMNSGIAAPLLVFL